MSTILTQSDYLRRVLDPNQLKIVIDAAAERLKPHIDTFDSIAFMGMSGSALAWPLSYILGKKVICVRKPQIKSHSWDAVEGVGTTRNYIIVDDLIDTGTTIRNIVNAINQMAIQNHPGYLHGPAYLPKCVGIYLFLGGGHGRCYDDEILEIPLL